MLSYGLPIVTGGFNAVEIQLRHQAGEITSEQANKQQIGNAGFASAAALGGGYVIPTAAAGTSNPLGWGVAGTLSLAYDVSIAQGTFNNYVEGQPLTQAFTNARKETHRSFGISGIDTLSYEILNPLLTPILTPLAEAIYSE